MHRDSLLSIPLVRELFIVLLAKLLLIFVIAHFFFSDPVEIDDEGLRLQEHFGLRASTLPSGSLSEPLFESKESPHDQ